MGTEEKKGKVLIQQGQQGTTVKLKTRHESSGLATHYRAQHLLRQEKKGVKEGICNSHLKRQKVHQGGTKNKRISGRKKNRKRKKVGHSLWEEKPFQKKGWKRGGVYPSIFGNAVIVGERLMPSVRARTRSSSGVAEIWS